eukprot:1177805-Prorocentrum_minimum.AAC.6
MARHREQPGYNKQKVETHEWWRVLGEVNKRFRSDERLKDIRPSHNVSTVQTHLQRHALNFFHFLGQTSRRSRLLYWWLLQRQSCAVSETTTNAVPDAIDIARSTFTYGTNDMGGIGRTLWKR